MEKGPSRASAARRTQEAMIGNALVVEDEQGVRDLVRRYLERDGLSVVATAKGAVALDVLNERQTDVMVLDLGLPDIDGEEVLAAAAEASIPVVVLTARSKVGERIKGLELGAADYITKPFSPRELVLRVAAVLRLAAGSQAHGDVLSVGKGRLLLDQLRHVCTLDGHVVSLTPTEWTLLTALATSPGRVFSRYELANRLRGYEVSGYERTIDSHIKNLRHKLGECAGCAAIVETVPGIGYRIGLCRDE